MPQERVAASIYFLTDAILNQFKDNIALASSFGAESIVLLHLISRVNNKTSIYLLNTGKLFEETISYKNRIVSQFCLKNVIDLQPTEENIKTYRSYR
jgi:phosphoadenosine phosphosulfate reductase